MGEYGNLRVEDSSGHGESTLLENNMKLYKGDMVSRPPFPRNILIEVTSVCNHSCIFCANSKSHIRAFIDRDIAIKSLEEAYSLGTREVGLYSRGEPLLDKNIAEYVRIAKEVGFEYVYITSNGALLTYSMAQNLVDAGLDSIKISMNAGTREKYELIHGRDDFDTVYENVSNLRKYIDLVGSNCKIFLSTVLCKYTCDDQQLIRKRYENIADEIEFFNVVNQGGTMPENSLLFIPGTETMGTGGPTCMMPFNRINITSEGYVDLCCVDYYNYLIVGDLKKNTLSEIWNSDRFVKVREMFIRGELGKLLCRNCMSCDIKEVVPLGKEYAYNCNIYECSKKDEIEKRIVSYQK